MLRRCFIIQALLFFCAVCCAAEPTQPLTIPAILTTDSIDITQSIEALTQNLKDLKVEERRLSGQQNIPAYSGTMRGEVFNRNAINWDAVRKLAVVKGQIAAINHLVFSLKATEEVEGRNVYSSRIGALPSQASIEPPLSTSSIGTTKNYSYTGGGSVRVKGYYRKNGTYVQSHTRRAPRR